MYKLKHKTLIKYRLSILLVVFLAFLIAGLYWTKVRYIDRYEAAANSANLVTLRDLVIRAADGLNVNAPVDAKTGDIYFPQARLYVPGDSNNYFYRMTYLYDPSGYSGDPGLSVSSRTVLNRNVSRLMAAQDMNSLFDVIPKLQSCQRGVTVSYAPITDNSHGRLKASVKLASGKTAYLYLENSCPELGDVVDQLKNIRSY